jgi:hypothetical protein
VALHAASGREDLAAVSTRALGDGLGHDLQALVSLLPAALAQERANRKMIVKHSSRLRVRHVHAGLTLLR